MPQFLRSALLAGALLLAAPTYALSAVQAGQPFPSNLQTKIDLTQLTGLRVAAQPVDMTTSPIWLLADTGRAVPGPPGDPDQEERQAPWNT